MADDGMQGKTTNGSGAPSEDPDRIAAEAEQNREQLDILLAELDRRRHAATDLQEQLRKHPVVLLTGAALAIGMLVGIAVAGARRRRRRQSPIGRMHRLREAMRAVVEHPERMTRNDPGIGRKLLIAAATSAVATLAKKLVTAQVRKASHGKV